MPPPRAPAPAPAAGAPPLAPRLPRGGGVHLPEVPRLDIGGAGAPPRPVAGPRRRGRGAGPGAAAAAAAGGERGGGGQQRAPLLQHRLQAEEEHRGDGAGVPPGAAGTPAPPTRAFFN